MTDSGPRDRPGAGTERWDVVVVGSGAAGLAAACTAAADGCRVLLLEAAETVGGTTAISGGMVWIPANDKAAAEGRADSLDAARAYLDAVLPPGDRGRLEAFLAAGPEAVRELEARTELRLRPVPTYPDYYPDLPGATTGGRVLEPVPFDARALGRDFSLLRDPLPEFTLFGGMMISREDIPHLRRAGRSVRSAWHVARLLARHAVRRLRAHRGTTLYLGNALAGRLFLSARRLGVTIRTGQSVEKLVVRNGAVMGVVAHRNGAEPHTLNTGSVVLATGGLSHGGELRARYVPGHAGLLTASVNPGASARGARLALDAGAHMSDGTDQGAFWVPASTFTRRDGTRGIFPHTVTDRAKPGLIAVDATGCRFTNEAVSYHEFVRAQLASEGRAIPAWLVCDRTFLWKYGLGKVKPFTRRRALDREIASGYLHQGMTTAELAASIGVPPSALHRTVDTFNGPARRGEDPDWGRGSNSYQRHLGDGDHKPNPCVAPIEAAPFFAVAVRPADLGMSAGIATDGQARVLDRGGRVVPGLFACGNDMASVMDGAYPGPGITLGPALTFGWLAGRWAARAARE